MCTRLLPTRLVLTFCVIIAAWLVCPTRVLSSDDGFETSIRPTLINQCLDCHGAEKQEGGLRLDNWQSILEGGDSGPALVPRSAATSLLMEAIRYQSLEMPPQHPLPETTIQAFADWIDQGAPWPDQQTLQPGRVLTTEDQNWWCFQPVRKPELPPVENPAWCRNPIDFFILNGLESAGLQPAAAVSPQQLRRRLSFTLTGLPPAPSDPLIEDLSPETVAQHIDDRLQQTGYGENQARLWLDLVRYADSDGYRADALRPQAAQYRDYVIQSFNQDQPYNDFLTQQLAGDEVEPDNPQAIIATMYLRHWIYEHNQRDVEGQWQEILDDITETTADAFLAMGMKCARCHDHKFDPLLQTDYYRLKAFFTPLLPREDQPIATPQQQADYHAQQERWEAATFAIRQELREIERPELLKHATREGFDKFVPEIKAMLLKWEKDRSPYEHQIATLARKQYDLEPEKLPQWLSEQAQARRLQLQAELATFDDLKPTPLPTQSFVVSDVGPISPPTHIPKDSTLTDMLPGFPKVLVPQLPTIDPPANGLRSTGRRTVLARWIASSENPLTARVMVNRVWQQHFGKGLVENASDFGHLTAEPAHAALLDWLAAQFMEDGWSVKQLHRHILNSATYQQSRQAANRQLALQVDPDNQLWWHVPVRRLAAEQICDAMLQASTELQQEKRTIYQPVMRNNIPPRLALFDFPDRIRSSANRHRTTTAPQALNLMNNPWIHKRAEALNQSLGDPDDKKWIPELYQRLFARLPDSQELQSVQQFLEDYQATLPPPPKISRTRTLIAQNQDKQPQDKQPQDLTGLSFPEVHPPLVELKPATLPKGDLTIEAIASLESLYPDANVRTLIAHWTGNTQQAGWSLGVTSTKSAYQPQNLILQLVGKQADGTQTYEVVPSHLRWQLDRPYYVAVSIRWSDTSTAGITFWLQDLSQPDLPVQTASVEHKVVEKPSPEHALWIGGRKTSSHWQGSIARIRIADQADQRWGWPTWERSSEDRPVLNLQAIDRAPWFSESSAADSPTPKFSVHFPDPIPLPANWQARQALIHALLNTNEMIYVD